MFSSAKKLLKSKSSKLQPPKLLDMNLFKIGGVNICGYRAIYEKLFMHHSWKKVKHIEVRRNKLYRLQFDSAKALVRNSNSSGRDLGELWHKKMGHLHHGALRLLRDTITGVR